MAFIKITSDEIVAIKNRLNAEMNRRQYNGSLVSYAGEDYQFEAIAPLQTSVDKDYYNKMATPLNAVNNTFTIISDSEMKTASYSDIESFDATLSLYEGNTSFTSSSNDCSAACSGMCITACSTGCTNQCTNQCTGCTGSCSGSCTGKCSGSCSGGCSGSCKGDCYGYCTSSCGDDGCSSNCESTGCRGDGCWQNCFYDCSSSCWTGY